jgi:hypothetical protein
MAVKGPNKFMYSPKDFKVILSKNIFKYEHRMFFNNSDKRFLILKTTMYHK